MSLAMMRRLPGAPNGLMEYLIVRAIHDLRQRGVDEVSLNFAAFGRQLRAPANTVDRAFGYGLRVADRWFQIERLSRFNAKFFPMAAPVSDLPTASGTPPLRTGRAVGRRAAPEAHAAHRKARSRRRYRPSLMRPDRMTERRISGSLTNQTQAATLAFTPRVPYLADIAAATPVGSTSIERCPARGSRMNGAPSARAVARPAETGSM